MSHLNTMNHSQKIVTTIEAVIDARIEDVFDFEVAEDVLPKVLTGYGLIPPIVGTSGNTAPWDQPGAVRIVHLKGGATAREQVTDWVRPTYFAYCSTDFTFSLKHLATKAEGQWWFEERDGRTHVRWTYTFTAKGPVSAVLLQLFARTQWAGLMRRCMQNTIDLTTANKPGSSAGRSSLPSQPARMAAA